MSQPTARRRIAWGLFIVLVLAGLSYGESLYKADPGEFEIATEATIKLAFRDRDRPLEVRATWPTGDGPFPIVIFSHGMGGSKDAYRPLVEHWASHGYVCLQPTHGDSIKLLTRKERRAYRSVKEFVNDPKRTGSWDERPREIASIIDQLPAIAKKVAPLADRMDPDRIIVAGHSFGAHTTGLVAGLKLFGPAGRGPNLADDRPIAALIISPQGLGRSIKPESWAAVRGPVMMVTGTNDKSPRNGKGGAWRMTAWEHLEPGDHRYLLYIEDARHNFGGISGVRRRGAGPINEDHVAYVRSATTAYFDAVARRDADAARFLAGDAMKQAADGEAAITPKK